MRLKMVRRLVDVNIIYATQPAQLAKFRKEAGKRIRLGRSMFPPSPFGPIYLSVSFISSFLGYFLVPMILSLALVPLSI